MDNPRPEKVAVVDEVKSRLQSSSAAILTEYRGMKVGDLSTLRRSLRAQGGDYKIYKNTLVRFAVKDLGLDELESMLVGPTAIAFVDGDAVGVAKALRDYARTNPLLIVKGGVLGESVLSAADATALADIPPREVLLARFAGMLAAPMQQFAGLLQALPRNFAYGLKALIDQGGATPGAATSASVDAEEASADGDVVADAVVEAASEPSAEDVVDVAAIDPTPEAEPQNENTEE
ncbi:MAG TPA: 50S ribosomal protein L10 [Acidimicrobiales bacterium]|nr:50S ribosomal protein L10 [Acidimicrobiales bacterium]